MSEVSRGIVITVGLTRQYGRDTIKFEMTEAVNVSSGLQRREAYANLLGQLKDQIELFERDNATMLTSHPANDKKSVSFDPVTRVVPVTFIVKENVEGKDRIKVRGGEFEKFGVQLYPECKSYPEDLNPHKLPYGIHDLTGRNLTMVVQMDGDKPKRVLQLG